VPLTMSAERVSRSFNRRPIFRDVSFTLRSGETLLIAGRNGSGKSTLVKILCGVLSPSSGNVRIHGASPGDQRNAFGVVSPYLQVYDEFSAMENLLLSMRVRGFKANPSLLEKFLERVSLSPGRVDPVRTYSSGMKQRLKYALALTHAPEILVLDEPMANLDEEGMGIVRTIMEETRRSGILIVATNDLADLDRFDMKVDLNAQS
jgi:heme exporter protein A